MKLTQIVEMKQKHPSYYNFDEVMDIYLRLQDFFKIDKPSDDDHNAYDDLKKTYEQTDPETRRDVELTVRDSDPEMAY